MAAAGFRDVESHRLPCVLSFESDARLLSALIDGGAVALAAKRFDESTRCAVDEEFLVSVSQYRRGHGYRIPGEFVIATALA